MNMNSLPQITVIIATKNRADALDKICFPPLLTQTFRNFEVIVWDASTDVRRNQCAQATCIVLKR